ncbi:MAG: hypothetical protein LUC19_05255, partial [Oscillospiraceae bacterium]|nr:hypothetical protein [Oscillospiraceae bacterium]
LFSLLSISPTPRVAAYFNISIFISFSKVAIYPFFALPTRTKPVKKANTPSGPRQSGAARKLSM